MPVLPIFDDDLYRFLIGAFALQRNDALRCQVLELPRVQRLCHQAVGSGGGPTLPSRHASGGGQADAEVSSLMRDSSGVQRRVEVVVATKTCAAGIVEFGRVTT